MPRSASGGKQGLMRFRTSLVLAVVLVLFTSACSVDWPQLGYGASHSGWSPDTALSRDSLHGLGSLVEKWYGQAGLNGSSPVVVKGVVYIVSGATLYAFSTSPAPSCAGAVQACAPLWTARLASPSESSPAVVNNVVYVAANASPTTSHNLYAFDALGVTHCSGIPKLCAPLWTAIVGSYQPNAPVVAGGVVYIASGFDAKLDAFDAAGNLGCSGSPKTCVPLWTGSTGDGVLGSPAVTGGKAYLASGNGLVSVFDAAGNVACSGTPKTCAPLWTATVGPMVLGTPAVANGTLYISSTDNRLWAFDASGTNGCSGTPRTCAPLWTTASIPDAYTNPNTSPAVANGVAYLGIGLEDDSGPIPTFSGLLAAFDASGATNCAGTPRVCTPLWTAPTSGWIAGQPAIANNVIYVRDTSTYAFDATGTINCSGSPKQCTALWGVIAYGTEYSSAVISGGVLYFTNDTVLEAWGLAS